MGLERRNVSSGSPWEEQVGYSRAVRAGAMVFVSGTTASGPKGEALFPGDAFGQTREILARIAMALEAAGAGVRDVVRTHMYVTDMERWREIGRAHAEFFGDVRPCATMVEVARLVDPEMLVEIEVEAVVADD